MKKLLNIALLISFLTTVMVPLTGLTIHKLASVIFLLLAVIHGITYRKRLGRKRFLLLSLVGASFASGIFGLLLDQYTWILAVHKVLSIAVVFFAAIHIFVFHKRLFAKQVSRA